MGPDGSRGSSTTSLVASHFSRGQQFGSCCQSKKVKGIVNESQSGPGGDSATPPVALLILLDLPGKQTQGSVSSQFRFFEVLLEAISSSSVSVYLQCRQNKIRSLSIKPVIFIYFRKK